LTPKILSYEFLKYFTVFLLLELMIEFKTSRHILKIFFLVYQKKILFFLFMKKFMKILILFSKENAEEE
jgi:hypothetical protein